MKINKLFCGLAFIFALFCFACGGVEYGGNNNENGYSNPQKPIVPQTAENIGQQPLTAVQNPIWFKCLRDISAEV